MRFINFKKLSLKTRFIYAFVSVIIIIIAIISLIVAHMIIILIRQTDEIPGLWRLLPYFAIPVTYLSMRALFFIYPFSFSKWVSIFITIISTSVVLLLLLKYRTNKFKTKVGIDHQ